MTQTVAEGKVSVDERGARRWAYGIVESVINGETIRGHRGGSRAEVHLLWESGYTVIVHANAIPPPADAVSDDIIAFITKQHALRARKTAARAE
jgi:hypothetical protein